jgi:Zinc finger, C3HC4 type (RING finger)
MWNPIAPDSPSRQSADPVEGHSPGHAALDSAATTAIASFAWNAHIGPTAALGAMRTLDVDETRALVARMSGQNSHRLVDELRCVLTDRLVASDTAQMMSGQWAGVSVAPRASEPWEAVYTLADDEVPRAVMDRDWANSAVRCRRAALPTPRSVRLAVAAAGIVPSTSCAEPMGSELVHAVRLLLRVRLTEAFFKRARRSPEVAQLLLGAVDQMTDEEAVHASVDHRWGDLECTRICHEIGPAASVPMQHEDTRRSAARLDVPNESATAADRVAPSPGTPMLSRQPSAMHRGDAPVSAETVAAYDVMFAALQDEWRRARDQYEEARMRVSPTTCHEASAREALVRESPIATADVVVQTACTVCMERVRDVAIIPCGHLLCSVCVPMCGQRCPVCRGHMADTVRIYL